MITPEKEISIDHSFIYSKQGLAASIVNSCYLNLIRGECTLEVWLNITWFNIFLCNL